MASSFECNFCDANVLWCSIPELGLRHVDDLEELIEEGRRENERDEMD